jgi:hypothetical protein
MSRSRLGSTNSAAQPQHDRGAARGALARLDREFALAVGDPSAGLVGAGLARDYLDLVSHHEGGIEADAELADQRAVLALVAGELLEELGGAGARDGAEVLDQLLAAHADAVVGDGERAPLGVGLEHDPEGSVLADEGRLGQRQIAQPVAGVGCVRDQLAEKDLFLAVE